MNISAYSKLKGICKNIVNVIAIPQQKQNIHLIRRKGTWEAKYAIFIQFERFVFVSTNVFGWVSFRSSQVSDN